MKSPILKLMVIASCLIAPLHGRAQEQDKGHDPFSDGLVPIFHSPSEEEELKHYMNGEKGELETAKVLAASACGAKNHDDQIDCRIGIYLDHIKKVIPESLETPWDLKNFTATLLRISLNQGVFIEQKIRSISYFTHEFREQDMLFSIDTAIKLYKTDVELFESKARMDVEYMRYALLFSQFVVSHYQELNKKEAVEYYFFASQLLLNVIEAKGNTLQNNFADEIRELKDIKEKTTPGYTGVLKDRHQQVRYASDEFNNVAQGLKTKFDTLEKRLAEQAAAQKRDKDERDHQDALDRATSREQVYFIDIGKYPNSIMAKDFVPGRRVRGEFDEFNFVYVSPANKEPKPGRLICAFDPIIPSGVYLDHQNTPWLRLAQGCLDEYPHGKDDNANGGTLTWPYKPNYVISKTTDPKLGDIAKFDVFERDH